MSSAPSTPRDGVGDEQVTPSEYKATLRTHADSGEQFKPLETASLKTIAAFLNSRTGGTLLIGVADDGTVHGLEADYATRSKKDQDARDFPWMPRSSTRRRPRPRRLEPNSLSASRTERRH